MIEPYSDLSLATLREKRMDDSVVIQKIKVQIYGISVFVILFSILNLVNMLGGNIVARKKELSMLESIGMEERQIRKMLFWESVMLIFPAVFVTLMGGGAAGYGVVNAAQKTAGYMDYRFPLIPSILYVLGMVLISLAVSYLGLKEQGRVSLAERIRNVD